ncbi:YitT family protein [Marinobacterium mangrovicola]|uniref:Putative 5xTM membrane YitT family protein n=1 Tax=Marinobacterium mangrovicola TaxID=1476959 RepID=A0A4R1GMM3_9GAMM|nr:YitT family protein [Marinobacterium mangrovicola]TCK05662.1 putative 5xTM membrane YitT family protein [Marinobacterium mangrovicola]
MVTTHRWLSILEGCLLVALGIHLLEASDLLISGTAGMGLILKQVTDLSFGQLFFLLNLPFYLLAIRCLGWSFAWRTFVAVSMLAGLSELMRLWADFNMEEPILAAVLGGMLVGFGLIILFRHQASLGGVNILAIFLEKRFDIHAGKTTLACDLLIGACGFAVYSPMQMAWSLAAFLALSSVVGRYHRPPRWARVPQQAG